METLTPAEWLAHTCALATRFVDLVARGEAVVDGEAVTPTMGRASQWNILFDRWCIQNPALPDVDPSPGVWAAMNTGGDRVNQLTAWINHHEAVCVAEAVTAGTKRKPLEVTARWRFPRGRFAVTVTRTDGRAWWIYTDPDTCTTRETLEDAERRLGLTSASRPTT